MQSQCVVKETLIGSNFALGSNNTNGSKGIISLPCTFFFISFTLWMQESFLLTLPSLSLVNAQPAGMEETTVPQRCHQADDILALSRIVKKARSDKMVSIITSSPLQMRHWQALSALLKCLVKTPHNQWALITYISPSFPPPSNKEEKTSKAQSRLITLERSEMLMWVSRQHLGSNERH